MFPYIAPCKFLMATTSGSRSSISLKYYANWKGSKLFSIFTHLCSSSYRQNCFTLSSTIKNKCQIILYLGLSCSQRFVLNEGTLDMHGLDLIYYSIIICNNLQTKKMNVFVSKFRNRRACNLG